MTPGPCLEAVAAGSVQSTGIIGARGSEEGEVTLAEAAGGRGSVASAHLEPGRWKRFRQLEGERRALGSPPSVRTKVFLASDLLPQRHIPARQGLNLDPHAKVP